MKYYTPIKNTPIRSSITVENLEIVPVLIMMKWLNQRVSSDLHLRVLHPDAPGSTNIVRSKFFNVFWDVQSEKHKFGQCPDRRLRLEGNTENEPKEIFALLELSAPRGVYIPNKITLSPVIFGMNDKPKLPYEGQDLVRFLYATKIILNESNIVWAPERLIHKLAELPVEIIYPTGRERFLSFTSRIACDYLKTLQNLHVLVWVQNMGHEVNMTLQNFESIFGVKLP